MVLVILKSFTLRGAIELKNVPKSGKSSKWLGGVIIKYKIKKIELFDIREWESEFSGFYKM